MGSVKDMKIIKEPKKDEEGLGHFVFSDRYSVFDWGEMPDRIKDKGKAICIATAYFFEKAEEIGINTHYAGIVEGGKAKRLDELNSAQNVMEFRALRVIKPALSGNTYDYSAYKGEKGNFLIPLEVIYRNSLPEGSSVFRRLKSGSLKLEDIGLDTEPVPGQVLDKPIIDVSTKLEITDRYINWEEAKSISGMSSKEIERMKEATMRIDGLISQEASKIGLKNEDGKVEYGFDMDRELMLVDALGTLDECRFTYNGIPVSKEIARIYYRKTAWYDAVQEAKEKDRQHWKEICALKPEPLPAGLAELISNIYRAYANELTGREWFEGVPKLRDVLDEIKEFLNI